METVVVVLVEPTVTPRGAGGGSQTRISLR